ncbi:MAG: GDSL-type esterase/lipase family protein [Bacteroidia bacterium]|nr:GDSL-type esterase/lipase family protein [Bacteroidia bacterium]
MILTGLSAGISVKATLINEQDKTKQAKEKPLKIFTLGDSNGALPSGWVNQLKKIRSNDTIFNISISGNTIGFNNNGRTSLNTLSNIGSYMEKACSKLGRIDMIILMLGTNDCKAVFKDSLSFVPENMRKLIQEIKLKSKLNKSKPVIFIVSPPPFGPDEMLEEKYKGGMERVTKLNEQLARIAREENVYFINTCQILSPVFKNLTTDGVHLNADGQKMIALIIQENLKFFTGSRIFKHND